eukprot:794384-Amphidinium_carterae.1
MLTNVLESSPFFVGVLEIPTVDQASTTLRRKQAGTQQHQSWQLPDGWVVLCLSLIHISEPTRPRLI